MSICSSSPSTMPSASAASASGSPDTTACSARRRRASRAPVMPPRLAPVRRTRSTISSPAMPLRRRWAAKSKLALGSFAGRRRWPLSESSSPIAARLGGELPPRPSNRSSTRVPASEPPLMRASADAPNAETRGRARRWARAEIARPSWSAADGWSRAARRAAPAALPARSRAAASAASTGARACARQATRTAAAARLSVASVCESASPAATAPAATCHGRVASRLTAGALRGAWRAASRRCRPPARAPPGSGSRHARRGTR